MTQRTKLELNVNQPIEIELLYDEPISGSSQYGEYHMYAVKLEGKEYTYFAPEEVHEKLKELRRGDKATITKLASQRNGKIVIAYDIATNENEEETEVKEEKDKLYTLLQRSYEDAIEMQKELNGIIDIEKAAITLFIARSKININV